VKAIAVTEAGAEDQVVEVSPQVYDVLPTGEDLKAAVEKKPELVYSIVAEQHLLEMEALLNVRKTDLEAKEQNWAEVLAQRQEALKDAEAKTVELKHEIENFAWRKNRLRGEIRNEMQLEAKAAHIEADQLEIARKARIETEQGKLVEKELQAELEAKIVAERKQRSDFQDKEMELRDHKRSAVTLVDNQTYELRNEIKALQREMQTIDQQIMLDAYEEQQQENALKHERSMIQHEHAGIQNETVELLDKLRDTAKQHQEEYYAFLDRRDVTQGVFNPNQ